MIRRFGVFCLIASTTLGACTDLLGIPEDPYLEEQQPQAAVRMPRIPSTTPGEQDPVDEGSDPVEAEVEDESPADETSGGAELDRPGATELTGDEEEPATTVSASDDDEEASAGEQQPAAPAAPPGAEPAAEPNNAEPGAEPAAEPAPPPPPPACVPERGPVDIVLIADNSPSMVTELTALESGLGDFAEQLEDENVDYRLILLSRFRTAARTAAASTNSALCLTRPLGGLAACPAAAPAASQRFLHYDVTVGESDSFDRLLDTFDFPDSHGLAANGWGERLRLGAAKVLIEVSDGDSVRPLQDVLGEMSLLAPEHFGSDPTAPGFVFHSVVGVRQRAFGNVAYGPGEPLETIACGTGATAADNAGQSYQTLSRLTGGLRFSICATNALPLVLTTLASDVIARSTLPCAATPAAEPDVATTAAQ